MPSGNDCRILVINFGKSPSQFNHPIENPSEINATLHIDGQSTKVDVPPDIIIDVVDEDDDITDDEDALPHDLAESDNEDLINVDDDGVD
nr:hypothetical protein [Tanacetum cinerariifolium]